MRDLGSCKSTNVAAAEFESKASDFAVVIRTLAIHFRDLAICKERLITFKKKAVPHLLCSRPSVSEE